MVIDLIIAAQSKYLIPKLVFSALWRHNLKYIEIFGQILASLGETVDTKSTFLKFGLFSNYKMKSIVVLVLLVNTLLDCKPIESEFESELEASEVKHLLSTNFTNCKDDKEHCVSDSESGRKNTSRMTVPDDVELIYPSKKPAQQSAFPGVGSIFDLIFAVS